MHRCQCGGFVPATVSRCPNCEALCLRPRTSTVVGLVVAAQMITACACYGGPITCQQVPHRGALVNSCTVLPDCDTPLPDGGSPVSDPTDALCFTGPVDAGP
jgi:hypothetical protein